MAAEECGAIVTPRAPTRRGHAVIHRPQRGFFRRPAHQGAIERGAQRVNVGPGALQPTVARVLLLRRVAGFDDAGESPARRVDRTAGGAEVEQHRRAVGANDDVVGGDVAMQHVGGVHHLQRVQDRGHDPVQLRLRGRAVETRQPALEAQSVLEAHDHVGGRVGLEHARDADDVGMLEAGQRARLVQEAGPAPIECGLVALRLGPHTHVGAPVREVDGIVFLDGDPHAETDVVCLVRDGEAAPADDATDAIAAVEQRIPRQEQSAVHALLLRRDRRGGLAESQEEPCSIGNGCTKA